jgi:hypothetical protein
MFGFTIEALDIPRDNLHEKWGSGGVEICLSSRQCGLS